MGLIITISLVIVTAIIVKLVELQYVWSRRSRGFPLPPGPPSYPILGHLLQIPGDNSEIYFHRLAEKYGHVSCVQIPGRTMIIINSAKAAIDLLDKRGNIYSDRAPTDVFMLMGWEDSMTFLPYGPRLQMHRKMVNEYFAKDKCSEYYPNQILEARTLVRNLVLSPDGFDNHVNQFATGIVLRINYGHEIKQGSENDEYLKIVTDASYCNKVLPSPGSNLVDLVPIMKYLPSWFPGAFPASQARSFRPIAERMHDFPYDDVLRQLDEGTAKESFLRAHLEGQRREGPNYPYSTKDIKGASSVIYIAGSDTTWSTIVTFLLAMVLYPDVQKRAQDELDRVIEKDRLPGFNDRENIPYIQYVVQETYRWHNAVPSGIAHKSMEDDIYNGMFIPKGSIVIANTRGITLDEDVYKNPCVYDPSRYSRGEPFPVGPFGFGRRKCPGQHLADASVWIAIAYIIASFDVLPFIDSDGTTILPKEEFTSGITSHVKPFRCTIKPRNERVKLVNIE